MFFIYKYSIWTSGGSQVSGGNTTTNSGELKTSSGLKANVGGEYGE